MPSLAAAAPPDRSPEMPDDALYAGVLRLLDEHRFTVTAAIPCCRCGLQWSGGLAPAEAAHRRHLAQHLTDLAQHSDTRPKDTRELNEH